MRRKLRAVFNLRNRYLLLLDLFLMSVSPLIALLLRTEDVGAIEVFLAPLMVYIVTSALTRAVVYIWSGLYREYWPYASVQELQTLAKASALGTIAVLVLDYVILMPAGVIGSGFPRSIPIIDAILTLLFVGGVRLGIRVVYYVYSHTVSSKPLKPALIAGAGVAGAMIAKELRTNPQLGYSPVGFLDDDVRKRRSRIHGIPVLGPLRHLGRVCRENKVELVIVAMPTAPGKIVRDVLFRARAANVETKTIPGLFEILHGTARVEHFRPIQLEDLLRRGTIHSDTRLVSDTIHGMRVLVTGAGGSIGSELCRQIKEFGPSELVLLGHGENSVFLIMKELAEVPRKDLKISPVIADIREKDRLAAVFAQFRPQIVFHAAAHKHVGLMEQNSADAVTNNVLGTRNLVEVCQDYGVERCVLVSTDKAVNPTSVMGVTKRVAELVVQDAARRTGKKFVAVRFGNVLGSRGSVVPILKRQIELGGPLTITHPDVRRFFMTIPEAVQLVLQAGSMGEGGEVFVLDMGEQIKVADLARDMIRLSGLEEGKDIEIVFTGLQPGEKMEEELFRKDELVERTEHDKVMVSKLNGDVGGLRSSHMGSFTSMVDILIDAARQDSSSNLEKLLHEIVPEFNRPDGANATGTDADMRGAQPSNTM